MPLQLRCQPSVLASTLAVGLMLTVASCASQGNSPSSAAAQPSSAAAQPSPLQSPFILEAMRIQAPTAAGGCSDGSLALSGGPGHCYSRIGTPVSITSATVSPVTPLQQQTPAGQPASSPTDVFTITLPASDKAALTAVTTTAANAQGYLAISVASKTWLLPQVTQPFPGTRFQITLPSKNQVLQLQHTLVTAPSS